METKIVHSKSILIKRITFNSELSTKLMYFESNILIQIDDIKNYLFFNDNLTPKIKHNKMEIINKLPIDIYKYYNEKFTNFAGILTLLSVFKLKSNICTKLEDWAYLKICLDNEPHFI